MKNNLEEITKDEMAFYDDLMYLPIQYHNNIAKEPFFEGRGNHSISKLEDICEQFKEYVHQQQVIKQGLKRIVIELRRKN